MCAAPALAGEPPPSPRSNRRRVSGQLGADAAYGKKDHDLTTRRPEKPVSVPWERYDEAEHTVLTWAAGRAWDRAAIAWVQAFIVRDDSTVGENVSCSWYCYGRPMACPVGC